MVHELKIAPNYFEKVVSKENPLKLGITIETLKLEIF